jgi:uncharacterized protein involved in exopolysaccharide biosynthesis
VLEARSSIGELRARTQQEVQRLSAGVGISGILNESRESQLRSALEAQRGRVLQLKADREELAVLQRDVDLAQRTYDAVAARLAQMTLEGASSQTNAALLVAATEPARPSFPRWPLNLTLGALSGLLLGIAAALARETADRRVRSIEDVARDLHLPVLGTVLAQQAVHRAGRTVELMRPQAGAAPLPASART